MLEADGYKAPELPYLAWVPCEAPKESFACMACLPMQLRDLPFSINVAKTKLCKVGR